MRKLLLILVFLTSNFITGQTNYYVSTSGSDLLNDGSLANPWLTIQYGIDQLNAGDVLEIRGGTYNEKLGIDVSGNSSAYITIRNYLNEEVIIDASTFNDDASIIWTDNAYLIIEGLHLTNNIFNFASGLTLQGAAHHIEIINNKISNIKFSANPNAPVTNNTNAVPLLIYADDPVNSLNNITISGNEVFNNQTGYSENISCGGNFTYFVIENNIVRDNTNIGIDIGGNYLPSILPPELDHGRNGIIRNNLVYNCNADYSTAAGIYIDGGKDIIVENNICYHNGYGGEIGCEENGSTSGIIFRNNIFYENFYAGMHIGGYDVNTTGIVLNSQVYNNTFYNNDVGNNYNGEIHLTKLADCKIENNIFFISSQNVYTYIIRDQVNLTIDYNLVYNLAGSSSIINVRSNGEDVGLQNFYSSTGYGVHSVYGNPYFNNAPNDFHIPKISTAINAGNPSYTTDINEVDVDNEQRTNGTIDCGTDEHYPTSLLLRTKILLDGAYNSGNNKMNIAINSNIPLTSPYLEDPRTVASIPQNVVDWVLVELRGSSNGTAIVSKSVFLNEDGNIVADDGTTGEIEISGSNGSYYVLVKHRNHLEVMSKLLVPLSASN
ncbi:MAG: right-handed parallel beta-helix repeat-containing protein [Melioribacteraceae bacterium]